MSRYRDGGDDEPFPNAGALWEANARRALRGKRGRKVLAELREALRALPAKRLIEGAMCTVGGEQRAMREYPVETSPAGVDYNEWCRRDLLEKVTTEGEGVCAIGAYLWWTKVKAGADPVEAFDALPTLLDSDEGDLDATAREAEAVGVAFSVAWELAYRNDEMYIGATPEQRYARFLNWLDAELTEPVGVTA